MLKQKIGAVLLAAIMVIGLLPGGRLTAAAQTEGYTLPEATTVHAEAALLVNLGSSMDKDVVLYAREADEVHAPGAMIRFMVITYALHRIEELGMDMDTATGTYTVEMFNNYVAGTGVPTVNMNFGETWTIRSLLKASFLQNASDAVTTLAFAIDGGVTPFVQGMNKLAEELGCDYTHFANVTGLDSLSQYTTARDVYRIIRYGMSFSRFEDLTSHLPFTVTPVSGGTERTLVTINHMHQSSSQFYYSPLMFSRTGLSEHEGRTCASVAQDSGYEYMVVVMGCPETNEAGESGLHYRDTKALFRWAFNNFSYSTVLAKSEILASVKVNLSWNADHVNLVPAAAYSTVVESQLDPDQVIKKVTVYQKELDAPIEKGMVLGKVELIVNVDQKIGEVELVAADSINRHWLLHTTRGVKNFFSSPWFWAAVGLLVALIIGYVILYITYNRRRRRERLGRVLK